ncbi:cysteine desulfurase NifS [Candidatus Pacearchaeota archaeon CG_4_9_14_3_um_filter_31_7]|nr:MAG: cysteine desulfurase NifS [Candidatus Pacearchaeota archaeon CG1_02_31_27]PIN91932.1 MAG: cysteine desulfurase NifS [Candidatus Pacearchaeota archaeon CG10_big_fil_rev_8_21_14_0_10_31_59]PIZ80554.1 MAG: cysteine desulfurase NifS [Candidatus Pacearchaeota archaeon CG_4_10_14_0_2_um_filter_31_10]PJA70789.1 MAG: cysteine desulfurase NifS [Candidatus Pacearchaeota archaeon CG_4_9_14_3_um_filter_31_7]
MKVYLDNSATSKMDEEVLKEMLPYFTEKYGNPSSLHSFGKEARDALNHSREKFAKFLNCRAEEIYFCSGGTESDNLAIKGIAYAMKKQNKNHIITSPIEHSAVLNTCRQLEQEGFKLTILNVDNEGFIDLKQLENSITEKTALVTIMFANSEIGTIQDIKKITNICHKKKTIFHTDAVQTFAKIPVDIKKLDIDSLSIASHKFHGPKGVGLLYVKKNIPIESIVQGGGHEKGLRSGTEDISGIVGMTKAADIALKNLGKNYNYMAKLRDRLINELSKIENSRLNGSKGEKRLPNNVNFSFSGVEGEALIMLLDMKGVAASAGSACSNILKGESHKASHVLEAIKCPENFINSPLRLTLSRFNTEEEIDYAVSAIKESVSNLRKISPFK